MRYDASMKRAERLLRQNFQEVAIEAHRLAGLGGPLRVEVGEGCITLSLYPKSTALTRGRRVYIAWDGGIDSEFLWQNGSPDGDPWQGTVQDVRDILEDALIEAEALAKQAGAIARELAKV